MCNQFPLAPAPGHPGVHPEVWVWRIDGDLVGAGCRLAAIPHLCRCHYCAATGCRTRLHVSSWPLSV